MGWLTVTLCSVTLLSLSTAVLSMKLDKEELRELDDLIEQLIEKHRDTNTGILNGKQRETLDRDDAVNPIQKTTVPRVFGVAHLNGKIYAIPFDESTKILSFNSADMSPAESIQVPGLNYPSDIAACSVTNKLFVLGRWPDNKWWRINPSPLAVEAMYPTDDSAETMSVLNGMVMMPTKLSGKLIKYDGSTGQPIATVMAAPYKSLTPRHVVELADGTCITSFRSSRGKDSNDQISVLNCTNGKIIGDSYGGARGDGPQQLNLPLHLAVCTGSRKILVADFGNRRIVRVDLESMTGTVVIQYSSSRGIEDGSDGNPAGRPWRIWVDEVARIFVVAISAGQVYVYNLSDVGC